MMDCRTTNDINFKSTVFSNKGGEEEEEEEEWEGRMIHHHCST
jgi:hypothetical protein